MASRVYSEEIVSGEIVGIDSVDTDLPAGYNWVIRDITGIILPETDGASAIGIVTLGVPLWFFAAVPGVERPFHWEGRVVVPGPSTITVATYGDLGTVNFAISGYQLTLP